MYSSQYIGSYSVVSINHGKDIFKNLPEGKITKGKKIVGEFKAYENNLGIVSIHFKQQPRIPWKYEDILVFKIKEKGSSEWYYQNEYYSGLTYDIPNLPIGFPVIEYSKGRTYQFELESLRGDERNALTVVDRRNIFSSRYQFDKAVLLNNSGELIKFLNYRVLNVFTTPEILFSSIVYLLPLFLYIAWISGMFTNLSRHLNKNKKIKKIIEKIYAQQVVLSSIFSTILIAVILFDIFKLQVINDFIYIILSVLWIMLLQFFKHSTKTTFVFVIILLLISLVSNELNEVASATKSSIWAFVFLCIFILQSTKESKKYDKS